MSIEDYPKLLALKEQGVLQWMYDRGFVSSKIFLRIECLQRYTYHKAQGLKKADAIKKSARDMNVNHMTVRRAIDEAY